MKEISIEIDSLGRVKKKGKGLGQQYENNVTKYAITLDSSLVNSTYFYYIIVVPPTSTGKKMYAVPMLTENFEYVISSAITQYVGTWKFCMLIMHKELSGGDTIPVEGVVKITDEWEDEVEKGIIDNVQLEEQIADINLKIAYEELLLVKQEVESAAEYATFQATYAKNVADELLADKENGTFNGAPGPKGEPGKDGVSPTAKVEQKVGGAILVVSDGNGTTTAELKDGQTPYIGPNGNWWVDEKDTGIRPDSDYVLPKAGKGYLGGVIVGENINVTEEGVISVADSPKFDDAVVLSGTEIETDSVLAIESNLHISGNSEQDSRTGKNKININVDALSKNGASTTIVGDDIKVNATSTTSSYLYVVLPLPNPDALLGKAMTLYSDIIPSASNTGQIAIYESSPTKVTAKRLALLEQSGSKQITFPTAYTEEGSYFTMFLYANATNGTAISGDFVTYSKLQLEEGAKTSYEPYGLQPSPEFPSEIRSVTGDVEVKVEGKNLLNIKEGYVNSATRTYKDDSLTLTSTLETGGYSTFYTFVKVKPNTSYYIQCKSTRTGNGGGGIIIQARKADGTTIREIFQKRDVLNAEGSFITPAETGELRVYFYSCANSGETTYRSATYSEVQLEEGVKTAYVPYVEPKIVQLPLGDIELRSTPDNVRDTFERVDGVWNKVSNVGSLVFDGNETWSYFNNSDGVMSRAFVSDENFANTTQISIYSDKFIGKTYNDFCYAQNNGFYIALSNGTTGGANRLFCTIDTNKLTISDVYQWKNWLSNNPTEIAYKLATPTYTPITDTALSSALDELEQLILHKGYNHITATGVNNVKAYLDLTIPSTASVTNMIETDSEQDLIVPLVSSVGNVKVKIPAVKENQMTLNPSTGVVKAKAIEMNHSPVATMFEISEVMGFARSYANKVVNELVEEKEALWLKSGMILMWSGSIDNVPVGWALCDGNNGTPDMRDLFVVGAGGTYEVGSTGGSNSVTLTEEQIPSHTHTGTTSEVSGEISYATSTTKSGDSSTNTFVSGIGSSSGSRTATAEVHTHTFTTEAAGSGKAVEILPPYYALAYIMKL